MQYTTIFSSLLACLSIATHVTTAARHPPGVGHHARGGHHGVSANLASTGPGGIYGPRFAGDILATSYDQTEYGRSGGACGWTQGIGGNEQPTLIRGAAQNFKFFGEGLSCGTCVKLTPTNAEIASKAHDEPLIVTIVNDCPPPCKSLDVEADVVTPYFGIREGQWDVHAQVVPCNFFQQGITIQYRQISNTPYDLRMGFRFQSGAFAKIAVKPTGTKAWHELVLANSLQYVLAPGQGSSQEVLEPNGKRLNLDFQFISFAGEEVIANNLPNGLNKVDTWIDTGVNFRRS